MSIRLISALIVVSLVASRSSVPARGQDTGGGHATGRPARPAGRHLRRGPPRPAGGARLRRPREPLLQRHLRQPHLPDDAGGRVSIFRADSGRTNGNTFDAQGRLISCEGAEQGPGGRRRIVRTDLKTGAVEVLTDRYQGKRYNSPTTSSPTPRAASGSPTRSTATTARAWRWTPRPSTGSTRTARSRGSCRSPTSSGPTGWR